MSKLDEKKALYEADLKKHIKGEVDVPFLHKVIKNLGPSIYNKDAETVSCSQKAELERVRENFLKKKLGLNESDDTLDHAIKEVCEQMGSSNRNKYRASFYYLLAKKFNKESALS